LDLVRRIAIALGDDAGDDPSRWYHTRYGELPSYGQLIEQLARTPAERQQLLRGYFEPTADERERHLKMPTAAHRALAKLVASGHLRVIVTTNFDRLTEQALSDEGIVPIVISSPDMVAGMIPLDHAKCIVIKVNGDYLDTRIRNTPGELSQYPPALSDLLGRVFEDYGLIICGWSADHDLALRDAIDRVRNRRYSLFWCARGTPSGSASELVKRRDGIVVPIESADAFFKSLQETVDILEATDTRDPLAAAVAVERMNRYLESGNQLRQRELVYELTEQVALGVPWRDADGDPTSSAGVLSGLRRYDALVAPLSATLATYVAWNDEGSALASHALGRLANLVGPNPPSSSAHVPAMYPVLVALYACGVTAVHERRWDTLTEVLVRTRVRWQPHDVPLLQVCYPWAVLHPKIQQRIVGWPTPAVGLSDHLARSVRQALRALIPDDFVFDVAFDVFEYLLGLTHACCVEIRFGKSLWAPVGRFVRDTEGTARVSRLVDDRLGPESARGEYPLFRSGLFGLDYVPFCDRREEFDAACALVAFQAAWT
jgi:hypothetical protein